MAGLPKLAVIVLLLVVAGSGCHATRSSRGDPAAVEKRLNEIFDAAAKKELKRLDSYHLYGPRFSKFGAEPHRLDSEAARAGEHAGLTAVENVQMRARDLKIDLFGSVAIATFLMEVNFSSGGREGSSTARGTLVFVHSDGEWKITHEHFSPVPEVK